MPPVKSGVTESRRALTELVKDMRAEGMTIRAIATEVGYSRQYVSDLLNDPDRLKLNARRASYAGVCEMCGAATDGSNGPESAPRHCISCAPVASRIWTHETILEAISVFVTENGRKPYSTDWLVSPLDPRFPYAPTVLRRFGTWNAAMQAAGLPTEAAGHYKRTPEIRQRMCAAQRHRRALERSRKTA